MVRSSCSDKIEGAYGKCTVTSWCNGNIQELFGAAWLQVGIIVNPRGALGKIKG